MKFDWKQFGKKIRQERKRQKISLKEVENKTGIDESALSRFELGKRVYRLDQYLQVCIALNIPPTKYLRIRGLD